MSQDKLQDWKDAHCNSECIITKNRVCHSTAHPEVTFGTEARCAGCPYLSE